MFAITIETRSRCHIDILHETSTRGSVGSSGITYSKSSASQTTAVKVSGFKQIHMIVMGTIFISILFSILISKKWPNTTSIPFVRSVSRCGLGGQ